ncbi:MAG: hypothetical protein ACFBSF_06475 [Leptolyngbyaceae cyanobacterium]
MQKITLFLASSSELKEDREQFEIFIYRKCKAWFDRDIFLHLDIWEDFLDAMAADGLQSEYNRAIKDCDIFVLLAHNKVGKYTAEEFEQAFGQFSETRKPFIFTYFKPATTRDRDELLAVLQTDQNNLSPAQANYEEALQIYRTLAEANPRTYLPDVAMTLINLSIFICRLNQTKSARSRLLPKPLNSCRTSKMFPA